MPDLAIIYCIDFGGSNRSMLLYVDSVQLIRLILLFVNGMSSFYTISEDKMSCRTTQLSVNTVAKTVQNSHQFNVSCQSFSKI